jgi:hypothetical protein
MAVAGPVPIKYGFTGLSFGATAASVPNYLNRYMCKQI